MQTVEEKRAYNRDRYSREREKILAQQKVRYGEKRDEIISKNQEYYQANRDKIVERAKQHYVGNRDEKRKYISDRLRDAKIRAVMIKGGECEHCGWDDHPAALQFHHRDPAEKVFSITSNNLTSPKKVPWDMILEEIDKCDLLCANCHFIVESAWEIEEGWNR